MKQIEKSIIEYRKAKTAKNTELNIAEKYCSLSRPEQKAFTEDDESSGSSSSLDFDQMSDNLFI